MLGKLSILNFQRKLSCTTQVHMIYECVEDIGWPITKTQICIIAYIIYCYIITNA